jgi:hypothetical protein
MLNRSARADSSMRCESRAIATAEHRMRVASCTGGVGWAQSAGVRVGWGAIAG